MNSSVKIIMKKNIATSLLSLALLMGCVAKYSKTLTQNEKNIIKISKSLVNKPYEANSVGEGFKSRYNQKPIYIESGFDCQTFIEYVLAKSISKDSDEFKKKIICVKYKNCQVGYHKKNHFFALDWITNNSEQGFISDITSQYEESKAVTKTISKKNWANTVLEEDSLYLPNLKNESEKQKRVQELKNLFKNTQDQEITQYFIPSEKITYDFIKKLPEVFFLGIVKENNLKPIIGTDIIVTHVGIGIKENGKLFLVHASSESKKIVEIDLVNYFQRDSLQNPNSGMIVLQVK